MSLSVGQVSQLTGMSRQTIRKAIARGTMSASVVPGPFGDEYRIEREEMVRYLRVHRRPGHRIIKGEGE